MTEPERITIFGTAPSTGGLVSPTYTVPESTEVVPDEVVDQYDPTKAGESPYDNPEFQQELKDGIQAQIEGWQKDWSVRIDKLMAALGLSRSEVMLYLLLMQTGKVCGLASGFQQMWNADTAQRRRALQDQLLELELQVAAKALGLELEVSEEPAVSPDQAVKQAVRGWKIR